MKNTIILKKKIRMAAAVVTLMTLLLFSFTGVAQENLTQLKQAIEKQPDSLSYHQAYLKEVDIEDPSIESQYRKWMGEFPNSATVPFAIGEALWRKELPAAKEFLVRATEINPHFAHAYFYLWIDGERWGDFEKSRTYIKKASELAPDNPDYAFYYANTYSDSDQEKYERLSLAVANKFSDSERGAQALYWLGANATDVAVKKDYDRILKNKFSPSEFRWSSSGMSSYYNLLLKDQPREAQKLAEEMRLGQTDERQQKNWESQVQIAKNIDQIQSLLAQNKPREALALIEETNPGRSSTAKELLLLSKAKGLDQLSKTKQAYDALRIAYAKEPETNLKKALMLYAPKLSKSEKDIAQDVQAIRDTTAKVATDFSLKQYFKEGKASLSDYKGKVVLLTYWFPGCGPCRGEFPHFQKVVDSFEGQDLVYLGLNIAPEQNDYVIPFMQSSGYSFIPLEDYKDRKKGNLDNRGAAPVNFLIDREGNVVFTNFRTDQHNQDVLQEMISSLLNK